MLVEGRRETNIKNKNTMRCKEITRRKGRKKKKKQKRLSKEEANKTKAQDKKFKEFNCRLSGQQTRT